MSSPSLSSEPKADGGNGHRAVKDVAPLGVTGRDRAERLEPVDRPFNFVAATVDHSVEAGRTATLTAPPPTVGPLILELWDGVLDLAPPQVAAVAAGQIGFVGLRGDRAECVGVRLPTEAL